MPGVTKGWLTVLSGAVGCAAGSGVVSSYAFGVFIKAIAREFGWTRADTTLGVSCFYVGAGFGAMWLGFLMQRYGVRRPALAFNAIFAATLICMSILPASIAVFCVVFSIMGVFAAAASLLPYAIALSGWFDSKRGTAMAIANAGTSAGGIFMPYYASGLLAHYGWRGAYVGVGLYVGVLSWLGLLLFFREPSGRSTAFARANDTPWHFILADKNFWIIGLPLFFISIALLGTITSLVPMLTDRNISMAHAASILGIVGGASFFSRVGVGMFLDRIHVRYVAGFIFALVALGCILLVGSTVSTAVWLGAACIGLGVGAESDLLSYAASRYFGPDRLSKSLGTIWIFFAWGAGIGSLGGSLSYDLTASYATSLYVFIFLAFLAVVLILTLGPYRYSAARTRAPSSSGILAPAE